MSNRYEQTPVQQNPKAEWVTPIVRQLQAGGAQAAPGNEDDTDPGGALDNS